MTLVTNGRAHEQLRDLAAHLRAMRGHMLRSWQASETRDPELTTASALTRTQFNDHIPQVLDAYEHRLCAENPNDKHQARLEHRENASEHGLHRWQQGFALRETMREWGHLHYCVLRELESYALAHPQLEVSVMPTARATLVRVCSEGVCESVTRYSRLQQAEAAGRVHDLERALQELQALERQRAEIWREAAHDLRGAVGVIANASALITAAPPAEPIRAGPAHLLQRNVTVLREMLGDLMDLARLEAGHEHRRIAPFDAAQLLRELCESVRSVAAERNLFLNSEGPVSLAVEGDAVKVRRIVQNLVLNALRETQEGGVQVIWQEHEGSARQWSVCIEDTGPGFDPLRAAPLERVLKQATIAAQQLEQPERLDARAGCDSNHAPTLPSKSTQTARPAGTGEGIGLSIVKRLCELLDASLELQTAAGSGTTFRVIFPRHYRISAHR